MDEELLRKLKYIRFNWLAANWVSCLEKAGKDNYSNTRLLKHIIEGEYELKQENSRKLRLNRAKIPEKFVIETFPFQRQPHLNKKRLVELYDSFGYMFQHQNIIWIGPTGTGKTGIAASFLIHAINRGYNGRFICFPDLVEKLHQSIADHSEAKVIQTFSSFDCLLIDELGYVEVEAVQVGLFFTLMHKRHKQKKTTLITTNLAFSQWTSFLKNSQLTAALIDRLTENSHVFNMKDCVSLRPKLAPA